jgi:hypothetical protein
MGTPAVYPLATRVQLEPRLRHHTQHVLFITAPDGDWADARSAWLRSGQHRWRLAAQACARHVGRGPSRHGLTRSVPAFTRRRASLASHHSPHCIGSNRDKSDTTLGALNPSQSALN